MLSQGSEQRLGVVGGETGEATSGLSLLRQPAFWRFTPGAVAQVLRTFSPPEASPRSSPLQTPPLSSGVILALPLSLLRLSLVTPSEEGDLSGGVLGCVLPPLRPLLCSGRRQTPGLNGQPFEAQEDLGRLTEAPSA